MRQRVAAVAAAAEPLRSNGDAYRIRCRRRRHRRPNNHLFRSSICAGLHLAVANVCGPCCPPRTHVSLAPCVCYIYQIRYGWPNSNGAHRKSIKP